MRVVVDGIIYQLQPQGGISRLFSEILPRMCDIDQSLQMTLLTSGQCLQPLPKHPRIQNRATPSVESFLRPRRLWWPVMPIARRLARSICRLGKTRDRIWHSTYYTTPQEWGASVWDGPVVVTVVDMIYEKFPQYFANSAPFCETKRRCVEQAQRVIAISENTRRDIIEWWGIPEDRVSVTYLAASSSLASLSSVQKDEFRERLGLQKPYILYVGNRGGYKNFQMLLETYAAWNRHIHFDLICIGGERDFPRSDRAIIVQAQLENSVKRFPSVSDEELSGFYSCAHAFVYPSLYEGFGIPPLEAMACGTPVIVSNTSSIPEVVGDAGLYFQPLDKEALLDALNTIVDNPPVRQDLVTKGLERAKMFSWDRTAAETHRVYQEAHQ